MLQLVSSLVIFVSAIVGGGGYFMYMEFKMAEQGLQAQMAFALGVLPWRTKL